MGLGISLRPVSRVVWGRENHRGRVTYLCEDGRRRTPERVVLWRWRKCGFGGYRLRPNIWRVLGEMPALRGRLPIEKIAEILGHKKREGGETAKLLPRPELICDLLVALSAQRVMALVAHHSDGIAVDAREPGVPDLFLFKRRPDGDPWCVRLVEVKRPDERIRSHQEAEIHYLRGLGLRAGVVRLIERPGPPRRQKEGV